MNTNCNAAHLAEYSFENAPSCTTSYNCDNCPHYNRRTLPTCPINVNKIFINGLSDIQQATEDGIISQKITTCYGCKSVTNRTITYGHHLIIDPSSLSDLNYMKSLNITHRTFFLNNVAKTVTVNDNRYCLAGIVSYINYSSAGDFINGYYVAFTYTGLNWYEYDDLTTQEFIC